MILHVMFCSNKINDYLKIVPFNTLLWPQVTSLYTLVSHAHTHKKVKQ